MLEKILEEIDREIEKQKEICFDLVGTSGWGVYENAMKQAKKIIRKHMNDGWIPVEDERKPKEYETVLCVTDEDYCFVGVYNQEYGFRTGDLDAEGEVTAWQPLPEPYRPEKGEEE